MGKFKDKVYSTFFKKESDQERNYYQKQLEIKIREITYTANKKTEIYEIVKNALSEAGNIIIGVAQNKNEEVLVVQQCYGINICFKLYGKSYKSCNNHPVIKATYKESFLGAAPYIRIDDINTRDNDIGNGSILMPYFLEYCKKTDAAYIDGELSDVDKGHFDRSQHFYEKHGFVCTFNNERTSGKIIYTLRHPVL